MMKSKLIIKYGKPIRLLLNEIEQSLYGLPADYDEVIEFDKLSNAELLDKLSNRWNDIIADAGVITLDGSNVPINPPSEEYQAEEELKFLKAVANQQRVELLSLPNWATWTAQQAQDNVSLLITNGITQETAEAAIDNLTAGNINQLIAVLKPILKNMVRAIYGIDTILKAMAKCIIFIRDILKP